MAVITLTNRADEYFSFSSGDDIFGGNGSDLLVAVFSDTRLFGENGHDALISILGGNELSGGNGKDYLQSSITNYTDSNMLLVDNANVLLGGNGNDFLTSTGAYMVGAFGTGADISGGKNNDTFWLRQSSDIRTTSAPGSSISDGTTIQGVFDIIRDYSAGELVDIGTTTLDPDGPDLVASGEGHTHLALDEGTYTLLRGDLVSDGSFTVSGSGSDTLLIYDYDPVNDGVTTIFEFEVEYSGSVVFQGVTDASLINIGDAGFTLMG